MADSDPEKLLEDAVDALVRDDIDGAEFVAREYLLTFGYIPASTAHYLFKLQDDDTELRRRLTGLDIREDRAPVA